MNISPPFHATTQAAPAARSPLFLLIGAVLACAALPAVAGSVVGGASHTVVAGDASEDWTVTGASQLTLAPGAVAGNIDLRESSTLTATDAVITGNDPYISLRIVNSNVSLLRTHLTNTAGAGMSVGTDLTGGLGPSRPTPTVSLDASEVEGLGTAVLVNGYGQLTVSGSTLIGHNDTSAGSTPFNGAGLQVFVGGADLRNGSLVRGDQHGVYMASRQIAGFTPEASRLIVDGSRVEGTSGSAIYVAPSGASDTDVEISLRNGAELAAGNGILIDLEASADPAYNVHADIDVSASSLRGDIRAATGTTGTLALADNATLLGGIDGALDVSLAGGAQWQLDKNSNIASLNLDNTGTIALGDGSAFHTLNVTGNYSGNGGTILFNTVLAGDDAATDKLVIGGDTSGSTNVRVNNVGGAGTQTNAGIELISVGGASNGVFALAGRAVGGQYEYFLHKGDGTDGNWYLRSVLPTAPDPCVTDPTLPQCGGVDPVDPVDPVNPVDPVEPPEPVLRPEGGAYLANLRASQDMFRIGYHERHAGQNSGRAWARVDGSRQGFDAVSRQLDIQGNSQALTVGADVWRAENGSGAGVMLSTGNATSTSTNPLSGYYARGKVKGEALGIYGTLRAGNTADPYGGFYLDGSLQRAQFRNRVEGVGLETERYDSRGWQGAVETGYAFRLGGSPNSSVFLEPQLQVGYNRWDDTRHSEVNGTVVTTDDTNGLFGRVGLRLSGVTRWEGSAAQVQPYLAANWLHSRAESQIRMDGELVDARIPRSRAEVSAGASVKFASGLGVWGGLARQQASGYHLTSAQMGVSYAW